MATQIISVQRSTSSARLWNVGRNHLRPDGTPVFVKWGNIAVKVPPRGESTDVDSRGRQLTARVVKHLVVHHTGLSDRPPVVAAAPHDLQQPSVQDVQSLGTALPVVEEPVEEVLADEPEVVEPEAVQVETISTKSTNKKK